MHDASKGKMFLAGERGHTETEWFRSYNTFNFGQYQNEHKAPFGPLYVCNDDTLAGGKSIRLTIEQPALVMLLPVVGALAYKDSTGRESILRAGEAQMLYLSASDIFEIRNPFEDDLINCLQFWFHCSGKNISSEQVSFDMDSRPNRLTNIFSNQPADTSSFIKAAIGKFKGRQEAVYRLQQARNGLFVFILQGAFEVQYRLMEGRDGLALWEVEEIELEALSNDAIILLIEVENIRGNI